MRILIAVLAIATIFLTSCQKEVNFANDNNNNGGNGGGNPGTLLVKIVEKSGASDSVTTTYSYDGSRRLINMKEVGTSQGSPVNTEFRYYRNSAGIITHFSTLDADLAAAGIDSFVTVVNYNSAASRYDGYVVNVNISGFVLSDSSVFGYDGSGNISEEDAYENDPIGGVYLTGKINYHYTNGNVSAFDLHDFDQTGAETFSVQNTIGYDSKTSPFRFGEEGFPIGHQEYFSANNILTEQATDSGGAADDQSLTVVYTYNSDGKPATSSTHILPDNTTINSSYTYQ